MEKSGFREAIHRIRGDVHIAISRLDDAVRSEETDEIRSYLLDGAEMLEDQAVAVSNLRARIRTEGLV